MKAVLDSGAEMSVVPAHVVPPSAYTGDKLKAAGVWGEGSLPLAKLTIGAEKGSSTMLVLVREGLQEVLLGQDFPYFADLMRTSLPSFAPTTGLFGPTLDKATPVAEEERSEPTQQEETTHCPPPLLMEVSECLAEEAEELGMGVEECEVMAVQTRAQKKKEQECIQEDDEASALSGATPIDLPQLDDSLFTGGRVRRRLSKHQKRIQAQERTQRRDTCEHREKHLVELSREELEEEQHNDESLQLQWTAAREARDGFLVDGGLLRHTSRDEWGDVRDQLVVPTRFRGELIRLAHGSHLGAHLGNKKTAQKILRRFFWPGLHRDVSEYCRACEECQRGKRGRMPRAPLHPLPAIEQPFKRVAVDIVGPLQRTKHGNKYILTMMDFCTRYPEAVPLRRIDASTVADALCEIFTRLGLPEEILSDQGSNFMSTLTEHTLSPLRHNLLSLAMHPFCNVCHCPF